MSKKPHNQRALLNYMRALARQAGIPATGKIAVVVSVLAGERLTKSEAYAWLQRQREIYRPGDVDLKTPVTRRFAKLAGAERSAKSAGRASRKAQWKADADRFYRSEEWRSVRFVALKRADGCCTLCGRSKRDHDVILHVDHIKPRSLFPKLALDASNLQVLCEDCNLGKGNRDTTDWRANNVIALVPAHAESA